MTFYYNTNTQEYPRYQGDLELLGWNIGQALPEGWVEVIQPELPETQENEVVEMSSPINNDGVWEVQFSIRDSTPEELYIRDVIRPLREKASKEELSPEEQSILDEWLAGQV